MYTPPHFKESDREALAHMVQQHPFAVLVSFEKGLHATHIPLMLRVSAEGEWRLLGHVSKANQQWHHFSEFQEVLAIFTGPHQFISSSWYEKTNVSTWNYQAVHCYGTTRILEEEEVKASLENLTNTFEAGMRHPRLFEHLPKEMVEDHIRGIVAFEITVTRIEGQFKLSQNRNPRDFHQIISELNQMNDPEAHRLAAAMQQHQNKSTD
ncbi:MAG: FMN-binding negative transcriptional regulator [Chitinophagales bacterium]